MMKSLSKYILVALSALAMGFTATSCSNDDEPDGPGGSKDSYVDLGLSVKWATCNVGAKSPEEIGSYFAWGETSTKAEYTESNYFDSNYTRFTTSGTKSICGTGRDAAYSKLGKDWRMPTTAEIVELVNGCSWVNTEVNGVAGVRGTAPNGNSIFLPITGMFGGSSIQSTSQGCYWGGEVASANKYASMISFFKGSSPRSSSYYRWEGMPIRPVYAKKESASGSGSSGSSNAKVEVTSISVGSKDKKGRYSVTIKVKASKLASGETVKTIGAKWGTVKGKPDSRDTRSSGTSASFTSAWHSGSTYYVTPILKTNKTGGEITGQTKSKKTP